MIRKNDRTVNNVCIGIDLDNTIACHDPLFYEIANDRGLIPPNTPPSKSAVKAFFLAQNKETIWTELQGAIYGDQMYRAKPFCDAVNVITWLNNNNFDCYIISHRSRYPYRGPKYDLHKAALDWLEDVGLMSKEKTGMSAERILLNESVDEKVKAIDGVGCDLFIDDLPTLLRNPHFPERCQPMLFDHHCKHRDLTELNAKSDWHSIRSYIGDRYAMDTDAEPIQLTATEKSAKINAL